MDRKTPREKRHERNRQQILTVARQMILDQGHEAISLRGIAKAVDFSPAGLYAYFNSKEVLFYSIADQEAFSLVAILQDIALDLPPEQRLLPLCEAYIEHALTHPALVRLFDTLMERRPSLAEPVSARSPYRVFLDCINSLAEQDKLAVAPGFGPEEITYSLWAVIHGMATLQMGRLKNFPADFSQIDHIALERFIEGLLQ